MKNTTPFVVKALIGLTLFISLTSAFLTPLFLYYNLPLPSTILSFSWQNFSSGMIWQPFTHLFLVSKGLYGIDLSLVVSLFLNCLFLFYIGTDLSDELESKNFFLLFLFGGAISSLCGSFVNPFFTLHGLSGVFIVLLVIFSFIYPQRELLLFYTLPIKTCYLALVIVFYMLLSTLSNLQFPYFVTYFSAALIGYLYATIFLKKLSPFNVTKKLDLALQRINIFNFQRYIPKKLSDEEYLDNILAKIAKKGMLSLSWREKEFLKKGKKK
jgi:membrane associated rhomboid family serine protease